MRLGSVSSVARRMAETSTSSEELRMQQVRDGFRRHLFDGCDELFGEFTGLRFEILWESSLARDPVGSRAVCRERDLGQNGNGECSTLPPWPPRSPVSTPHGGPHSFRHPIVIEGIHLGFAVLQASRVVPMKGKGSGQLISLDPSGETIAGALFQRATALVRLVVHDAVAATLAEMRAEELDRVRREARKPRRGRGEVRRVVLHPSRLGDGRPGASRIPAVVGLILDFVHASYPQPISLKDFAREHELNPSYLSTVFSSNVGVPFKKYLTDFRLKKAREFLANPDVKIPEVAAAVGYPEQNRFMAVFKAATGLSPVAFRQGETPG